MGLMSYLGIKDPTFQLVGSYGDPSVNWQNQGSDLLMDGGWSPFQQWELWLSKPEPSVVFVEFRLSDFIKGKIKEKVKPELESPLSSFLRSDAR